jgi:hypothetical protein
VKEAALLAYLLPPGERHDAKPRAALVLLAEGLGALRALKPA